MKPKKKSHSLLGVTRSKAKMFEYSVPEEHHIKIVREPSRLFELAIGIIGEISARINSNQLDRGRYKEWQKDLLFAAQFFDSFIQSRLDSELDSYLLLLGASAYYLCDLPGSSHVLASHIGNDYPDIEGSGLESLIIWLLQGDFDSKLKEGGGGFDRISIELQDLIRIYFSTGHGDSAIYSSSNNLRQLAYQIGTPRQLLLADIACSVITTRIQNSSWYCLPRYTENDVTEWAEVIKRNGFIKELWPAQKLLGENGIYRGSSAVIQMPTSAGKTRATEIIIRSAFLSNRTSIALVVAPFRALCHEIRDSFKSSFHDEDVHVNELTDVLQVDFDFSGNPDHKQILIMTPEKLVYVLRHTPELSKLIGLLIYDEGHQFDNGIRGVTYELLLTSLKSMLPPGVQTILISAVMSNADSVGKWLNGDQSEVVSGVDLNPTYKSVAFASWQDYLGRLEFVADHNPEESEFFVPRIIEEQTLNLKGREKKKRVFPSREDYQSIALFLGVKLVKNGSVAIFCGKKTSASSLCEIIIDAYDRGLSTPMPLHYSNSAEVKKLHALHERNLGMDSSSTKCASLGIYSHHGNTPHGIRLSVEHAMKEGLVKFVICTSTLSQGVNLPIRYLIVTSVYQNAERLKVRDFQNLIGRAGRAGMYTEGSIIFADPKVYDRKKVKKEKWRWQQVKDMLKSDKSEPCVSNLLSIFEPLMSDDREKWIQHEPLKFVSDYINQPELIYRLPEIISSLHGNSGFSKEGVKRQVDWKLRIITSIESFLMAHWGGEESVSLEDVAGELAKGTLAYALADNEQKSNIINLFIMIAQHIDKSIPDSEDKEKYGRTLLGVKDSLAVDNWVRSNMQELLVCDSIENLLFVLWPVLIENIQNSAFTKCDKPEVLKEIAVNWINGVSYGQMFEILRNSGAKRISKSQKRQYKLEHVIDICDSALAYEATLIISAVAEFVEATNVNSYDELIQTLAELHKSLKYGLSSQSAINIYELGFADRVISRELSDVLESNLPLSLKGVLLQEIRDKEEECRSVLEIYPSYFIEILNKIIVKRKS